MKLTCPSSCSWTTLSPTPWVLHLRLACSCQSNRPNLTFVSSSIIFISNDNKPFWHMSWSRRAVERSLWTSSASVSLSRRQWLNVESRERERCCGFSDLTSSLLNTPQLLSCSFPSSCNNEEDKQRMQFLNDKTLTLWSTLSPLP